MKNNTELIIYRGTNEIGGNCIEIRHNQTKLLFDCGVPLNALDEKDFEKYMPKIKGLYKGESKEFDAIFLTHAHPDHYGLLKYMNPEIPIYTSKITYNILMNITSLVSDFDAKSLNIQIIDSEIKYGDFNIKAHDVDHSIAGACAYEIKIHDKTIVYTGDLRFHGRCSWKSFKFENNIKNPDYLIMEGTTLSRKTKSVIEEKELENKFKKAFSDTRLQLVTFSPLNIDRFITVYKACLNENRTLVIDPYTCYILENYKPLSKNIPQYDWKNIRTYFAANSITTKLKENHILDKYIIKKIGLENIKKNPKKYVIKGNYFINKKILEEFDKKDLNIIYSMWQGYIEKNEQFAPYKDTMEKIHASGHAYPNDLKDFVNKVNPKHIIPIHTEVKEEYKNFFEQDIIILEDNTTLNI